MILGTCVKEKHINYNIKFREFVCNPAFLTVDFMVVFRAIDETPDDLIANDVIFTINGKRYSTFHVNCSVQAEFGFIRLLLPIEKTGPLCDIDFDWGVTGKYRVMKNGVETLSSYFSHGGFYSHK